VLIMRYFNNTCVHSSALIGNTSLIGRYTTSEAIIHSFIDVMFLISYMYESGRFIRVIGYVTGRKTGDSPPPPVLLEARIYLCSQASTPIQAHMASYSMEIGSFFLGDNAGGP